MNTQNNIIICYTENVFIQYYHQMFIYFFPQVLKIQKEALHEPLKAEM